MATKRQPSSERSLSPDRPPVSPITIDSSSDDNDNILPSTEQPQDPYLTGTTAVNSKQSHILRPSSIPANLAVNQAHQNLNLALQNQGTPLAYPLTYPLMQPPKLPVMEDGIEDMIADVLNCGMHFLDQIRTKTDLGIDENFQKMLKDPVPQAKKPLAIAADAEIPEEIYNYFKALTYHTNKTLAVIYIWLDLYRIDIYVPFSMVCDIQVRLIHDGKTLLAWKPAPLYAQTIDAQFTMLANWSSARLLHNWSRTEFGKKQIETMELMIDGKRTSDAQTADKMLKKLDIQQWLVYLNGPKGAWLKRINQRFQ